MQIRETVLLVEDDAALSTLVSGLLEEAGYEPIRIADHALIAAAVQRWRPRCVILDGSPTTLEGRSWDDAAAIRRAHPALPVLMFTADTAARGEADAGETKRSRAAGFAGSVAKPFLVEEFLATLKASMPGPPSPMMNRRSTDRKAVPTEAITVFPDLNGQLATEAHEADFVTSAVHELRQPLSVMRGQMQLALRRIANDPERGRIAIDLAIAQADRMNAMIEEVLDHSRLTANALSLEVVAFDVVDAAAEAVDRHQHELPPRITLTLPDPPTVTVRGDPGRIAQILDNLLDNALKYSAPSTPLTVTVTIAGGDAYIRVEDHGVGVPDDELIRLFSPYFRTSRTRQIVGTGLGLHISRQLAERHGGRLWLESSSSAGSVFTLALPLSK